MKSKIKDNKNLIVLGGIGLVGLYVLSQSDTGLLGGGFGGGGGIPLLPGDTEDAAEGDVSTEYVYPEEAPMWDDESRFGTKKTYAPSLIPTQPLEYYSQGGSSELSEYATGEQQLKSVMTLQHYADPFAYAFSGRTDTIPNMRDIVDPKKVVKKPVQWEEASVGGFWDFFYPATQIGKGARGRDAMVSAKPKKVEAKKIMGEVTNRSNSPYKRIYSAVSSGGSSRSSKKNYSHEKTDSGEKVTVSGGRVRPGWQ